MISSAVIYFDDGIPEYMGGMQRIGEVKFYDEQGNEIHNPTLSNSFVNRAEVDSNLDELRKQVAAELGLDIDDVEFE